MDIEKAFEELKKALPSDKVLKNESMKNHTSFKIGGPVDIMVLPSENDHIRKAFSILQENDVPVMVMGNGSNLLVRDKGIRGAIIKLADKYSDVIVEGELITAHSGILLSTLSKLALKNGLVGLEFASGIPGTLGGAVTMNAGAYDGEMKDVVQWATAMDHHGNIEKYDIKKLSLGYRTSIIQSLDLIVLEVQIKLVKGNCDESSKKIKEFTRRRREKQPLNYPSAGSTFKRPPGYYAGKLIQDAHLRGLRIGDAQVSELHSGFIINLGNATANDVILLIETIQNRVMEKLGVELQTEVKIVGEK